MVFWLSVFGSHCMRGGDGGDKWFLSCLCLVFSRSFVHNCKTAKCFPNQGRPKFGQICAKSKAVLKFDISRLCSQTFILFQYFSNPISYYWICYRLKGQVGTFSLATSIQKPVFQSHPLKIFALKAALIESISPF